MTPRPRSLARRAALAVGAVGALAAAIAPVAGSQLGDGDPVTAQVADSGQPAAAAPIVTVTGTIDLCAKEGTATVAGAEIAIWGYAVKPAAGSCADAPAPTLPGPTLAVAQSTTPVTVRLTNALSRMTSLVFPGLPGVPDTTGVPAGGTRSYTIKPDAPGTYLYESGVHRPRQIPMGLHGALLVRPTTAGQAYASAASAYDREAVVVLSEVDPGLHANPAGYDLRKYAPRYWLINGKAFPQTDLIEAAAGERVLLRYLNAGNKHHTMTLLGTHQRVVGNDGNAVRNPFDAVAETIAPGSTVDAIATLPADTPAGGKLPLFSSQMRLQNGRDFPGGMLTYLVAR